MAVTVSGSSITFEDNTVQTTRPFKLLAEVINSSTTSHTFYSLSGYNEIIIVWDANQYTGPSGSSLTLTESTTSVLYRTLQGHTLLRAATNVTPNVTAAAQLVNNTNLLASFSSGSSFAKGRVVLSRIRNMTGSLTPRWNAQISGEVVVIFFLAI